MAFNITALTDAFLDQVNGGNFFQAVATGTVADQAQRYAVGSKGTQQLNVNTSNLVFGIDPGAANAFVNTNTSTLSLGKRDIVVDGVGAQGFADVAALYGSYAGANVGGAADESVVNGFVEDMVNKTSFAFAQSFYGGFGTGTPTNGLSDVIHGTAIAVTGGTTVSATNIIGKVERFIASYYALSGHNALENRELDIIMSMADYRKLRVAYRAANYFNTDIVSERGLAMSTWLDDSRITIYGDPAYTGQMMILPLDTVYVGDPGINENLDPQIWYSDDRNQVGYRIVYFGGVQILQQSHGRVANHTA